MIYQPLGPDEASRAIDWLVQADPRGEFSGFHVAVGDESVWLLHAMYEYPGAPDVTVNDTQLRSDFPEGEVGDVLFELRGTNIESGIAGSPGPPWRRLLWADAVTTPFEDQPYGPSFRWLANYYDAGVQGAPEGSMDLETLTAVVAAIAQQTPQQQVFAHFAEGSAWSARHIDARFGDGPVVIMVRPEHLVDLPFESSPSNIWPADRSWIVYTDYDLSGTFVSGPTDFIARLEASPDLEVIRWSLPSGE